MDNKSKIVEVYNVAEIANNISIDRYDKGFPITVIVGEIAIKVKDVIINGQNAEDFYKDTLEIPVEQIRAQKLSELDHLLSERAILISSSIIRYLNSNEAESAKLGISSDYPDLKLKTLDHANFHYLCNEKIIEDDDNISDYLLGKLEISDINFNGKIQEILKKINENELTGFVVNIGTKDGNIHREYFSEVNNIGGDIAGLKYFSAMHNGEREDFHIRDLKEAFIAKYYN